MHPLANRRYNKFFSIGRCKYLNILPNFPFGKRHAPLFFYSSYICMRASPRICALNNKKISARRLKYQNGVGNLK